MKNAIILIRVSSSKQAIDGVGHEDQLAQCRLFLKKQGWKEVKVFPLIESGATKEREFFQEVLDFAIDPKNKIDFIVFRNIDRFTREGSAGYLKWKEQLKKYNVQIRDVYGTIGEEVNTLEHLGVEYEWSSYSPSESSEIQVAEQAKAERRQILSRTIGAEILQTQDGYYPRTPPYGYKTKKIETEHGKRTILVPVPEESFFVKKVFEMRAQGYNNPQIADEINKLGYKSRTRNKRDKRTQVAIGKIGGNPAKANRVGDILGRTIYAGVICEKWTKYQPVVAKFPGFIDVDLFNRANKNKILIQVDDNNAIILYGKEAQTEPEKKRVTKHNPLYPFKNVVLCPECKKTLRGSAPTGGGGKKHPQYHCSNKKHKYWSIKQKEFNDTVYDFIGRIEFDEGKHRLLEALFYEKWDKKRAHIIEESQAKEQNVANLLSEQKAVFQQIKRVGSEVVRKALEEEYEELDNKIKQAREIRDKQVKKEVNAKLGFKYAKYFMEHIEELLIDTENVRRQEQLFGMIFDELPTYDQIVDGTANLTEYFRLSKEENLNGDPDRARTGDLFRDREVC